MPQKNSESDSVRDQQQGYDESRNEDPCYDDAKSAWQRYQRKQCERRRNNVPIGGGMREGGRHIGRHDARDQECQSDEAEAVQDEKRLQRLRPVCEAESRPDVSCRDDPPGDETECDAREKAEL